MNSKRFAASLALVLALAVTPALAGCAGIQQVVEGATGGKVSLPGQSVPDDFPKADVPLVDGDVIFGAGVGTDDGKAWNVTISVASMDVVDDIKSQLEGAGFTSNDAGIGATDESAALLFTSEKYSVAVVVTKGTDSGFVANYTVTEAAQ